MTPADSPADQAFARYRQTGSPEDLARVFDDCAPQLLLLANHVAGDGGVAEDLVQMTFLRAIEVADSFEAGRPVQPWLVGILVREARKHRRQAARRPDADRVTEPGAAAIPAEIAERKEFQAAVAKALTELPPAYREVLTLRLVHGLTPTEIGHARGVSPETVKTQIRRGTERLRRLLPPSFATAVVAMALTGGALAAIRQNVLAAATASQAAALAAASTATAGTLATTAYTASLAQPTTLATVATTATVGAGLARKLALVIGIGGSVALGAWAWSTLEGEPPVPTVEERAVIPDPQRGGPALRAVAADEPVTPKPAPVDPARVTFAGRVLGASGMGLAGVPVEIVRLHPDLLVVPAAGLPGTTTEPEFVAGRATTDDRGRFTIGGVRPAGAFLLVLAPGTDRVDWQLIDHTPEPGAIVELGERRIPRRKRLRGRILDEVGFPVAGANLRHVGEPWSNDTSLGLVGAALALVGTDAFAPAGGLVVRWADRPQVVTVPPWFQALYQRILARSATTDENGRFEWVTTRDEPLHLTVTGPAIRSARIRVPVGGENLDVGSFKVYRVGSIRLMVRDWTGDPLPNAEVMLGEFRESAAGTPLRPVGTTDADGELHTPWDEQQRVTVAVRRGPGEPWQVTEGLSPYDRITIAMPRSFPVTLRVVRRTGSAQSPMTERVACRLLPGKFAPHLSPGLLTMHQLGAVDPLDLTGRRTDAAPGVIQLDAVPAGSWTLLVSADGHSSTAVALDVDGIEHVTAELAPLEPTVVSVDDSRFQRLERAPIYARGVEERDRVHEFPVLIGATDAEGMLTLARSRWRRHSVGTLSGELGACTTRAAGGVDRLAVVLPPRGSISGRVTEQGEPPTSTWTVLAQALRRPQDPPPALGPTTVFIPTHPDGTFRLPPLEPGRWALRAMRVPRRLSHPSQLLPVLLPEPTDQPLVDLVLEPRTHESVSIEALPPAQDPAANPVDEGPVTLRGTIDIDPRPANGLKVGVHQSGQWAWFEVAADGTFDTGIVPAGTTPMIIVAADQAGTGVLPKEFLWYNSVSPTPGGIRIRSQQLLVTCSLTTARRDHAAWFTMTMEGRGADGARCRFIARADKAGWVRMTLPKGTYTLRGEHALHGWIVRRGIPIEIPIALNYRLDPLVTASGRVNPLGLRVALPKGSTIEFARVGSSTLAEFLRGSAMVPIERTVGLDGEHRFQVPDLLPGSYRVTVYPALRLANGAILSPAQANIQIPQGTIRVGAGGRAGIVLSKPK